MSASPGPRHREDPYTRRIIRDGERTLIESRCTRCGVTIVGSVTETLMADEARHVQQCPNCRETGSA